MSAIERCYGYCGRVVDPSFQPGTSTNSTYGGVYGNMSVVPGSIFAMSVDALVQLLGDDGANSLLANTTCMACPRGYRSDGVLCQPCEGKLDAYSILFLIAMSMVVYWHVLAVSTASFSGEAGRRHFNTVIFTLFEALLASLLAVIALTEGTFQVRSCGVKNVADWYPIFHDPRPDYINKVHCTNEVVYPLYTYMLLFLFFYAAVLLALRTPLLLFKRSSNFLRMRVTTSQMKTGAWDAALAMPLYALLYFLIGGILFYSFPFLLFAVAMVLIIGSELEGGQGAPLARALTFLAFYVCIPFISLWAIKEYYTDNDPLHYIWVALGVVAPKLISRLTWKLTNPQRFPDR